MRHTQEKWRSFIPNDSPFIMKATPPTGICKKSEKCIHLKDDICISKYQTRKNADDAMIRFKAHGFNVNLIAKAEGGQS